MTEIRTLPFSKCPVASVFQYLPQQKTSILPPIQQKSLKLTLNTLNYGNNLFFMERWLRLNLLTQDVENDYTAEGTTTGKTIRNEGIARFIIEEGSEINHDTILSILNQSDGIIRNHLQQGYSIQTKFCKFTPRVTGSWLGPNARFDRDIHKVTLDITPSTEMREALEMVNVRVLGVKDSGAYIGLITDTSTGLTDGIITANEDIIIEGEPDLGVYFMDKEDDIHPVDRRLTQNDSKKIIARVPELPPGEYRLRIATRYSNETNLLKEPRIIDYENLLFIE